jgi:RNA polymerase sigma-B factor
MVDREALRERRLFLRLADPADPVDAEAVMRRYLPLARRLAARYRATGEPEDDLRQVAAVGLLNAIRRYDPERGVMFSSYAMPTILGELRRHLRDTTWGVHVPRDLQELALRVERGANAQTAQLGRAPTTDELAGGLELTQGEVARGRMVMGARRPLSLELPRTTDGEEGTLSETVGGEDDALEDVVERGVLDQLLSAVTRRERELLRLRFEEDLTQREIGRRIGVSQMHVSRMLRDVLARLQDGSAWASPALAGSTGAVTGRRGAPSDGARPAPV